MAMAFGEENEAQCVINESVIFNRLSNLRIEKRRKAAAWQRHRNSEKANAAIESKTIAAKIMAKKNRNGAAHRKAAEKKAA